MGIINFGGWILEIISTKSNKEYYIVEDGELMGKAYLYEFKVANIILFVEQIGEKSVGIIEIKLEVWSSNIRAINLYNKFDFFLEKKTEVSIGMFL